MKPAIFAAVCAFALTPLPSSADDEVPARRPSIGAGIAALDKEFVRTAKCPTAVGVELARIDEGGSFSRSELRTGDIIFRIGDSRIANVEAFRAWVKATAEGRVYRFAVWRRQLNGRWQKETVPVKIAFVDGRPDDASEAVHYFPVAGGRLRVQVDSPIIYLGAKGEKRFYGFLTHTLRPADGETQQDAEGFYSIDGKAKQITIDSADARLLKVGHDDKLGTFFDFKEEGTANVIIGLAGKTFNVALQIVRIQINPGDDSKVAIEALGLPDKEERHFVSWPDAKEFDNVIYAPDAGEGTIAAKHWRYKKRPHLVLSIVDGHVKAISSYRERDPVAEVEALLKAAGAVD